MTRRFFIFLMTLGLFGCDSNLVEDLVLMPEIKSVQLSHFSVEDRQAFFDISVHNPNTFPLPISQLAGDIKLNNLAIGSLSAHSQQNLAAFDTQNVTLPLPLNPDAFVNTAHGVLLKGKAEYQFNGMVDTGLGLVPLSKQRELPAQELLRSLVP
jgi:LEA14-like dessication related protein